MIKRSKILIVAAACILLLVVVALLLMSKPASQPQKLTGIEKGSATSQVGLQGAEKLNDILLPEQYFALKQALSNYIRTKVSSSVLSAQIVPGSTVVNNDGSINFSVSTSPNKTFNVVLQRPSAITLVFTVPADGYSATLYPYATN